MQVVSINLRTPLTGSQRPNKVKIKKLSHASFAGLSRDFGTSSASVGISAASLKSLTQHLSWRRTLESTLSKQSNHDRHPRGSCQASSASSSPPIRAFCLINALPHVPHLTHPSLLSTTTQIIQSHIRLLHTFPDLNIITSSLLAYTTCCTSWERSYPVLLHFSASKKSESDFAPACTAETNLFHPWPTVKVLLTQFPFLHV